MGSMLSEGLRVLLVDDDATCLKIIGRMLQHCRYSVTSCNQPSDALSLLRRQKGEFDLVITDVKMPGMDGFKLLEHIDHELDIPVIMMSADAEKDTMVKGLRKGACFYLVKPVRMDQVMTIWQHVIRRNQEKIKDNEQAGRIEGNGRKRSIPAVIKEEVAQNNIRGVDDDDEEEEEEEVGCASVTQGNWETSRKRKKMVKEGEDSADKNDDDKQKKPRIMWNSELHDQFIDAVNRIGLDRAVPKKILEIMKCPGLSRENVASHLQKYRLYIKKVHEANLYNAMGAKPPNPVPSRSIFGHAPRQVLQQYSSFPRQNIAPYLQVSPHPPPFVLHSPYGAALTAMPRPPMNQMTYNHPFSRFHQPQLLNNQLMINPGNPFGFHHQQRPQQQQQQPQLMSASLPINGSSYMTPGRMQVFPRNFNDDLFLNSGTGPLKEARTIDEPLPDFNPSDFIDMMGDLGGQNCRPTGGGSGTCTETRLHEGQSNAHQFRSEEENLADVLRGFMSSGNGDLGDLVKKKDESNECEDAMFVNIIKSCEDENEALNLVANENNTGFQN